MPKTASVSILVLDHEVEVSLGRDTMIELIGVKRREEQVLGRVRQIVEGVVEGRFEETIWEAGGKIVKSRGVVYLENEGKLTSSRTTVMGWLWPWGKTTIRYEPYR